MVRVGDEDREAIGTCHRCQVQFVARRSDRELTTMLLEVHAAICPGGLRAGERVEPAAVRSLLRNEMRVSV